VQNKSKQTICGIVSLIIFSCFLLGSEVFVYSFDSLGNVEVDFFTENASQQPTKQPLEKDNQQKPHKHIVLSHLYSLIDSEAQISLIHPYAAAFIQPQLLSIQFPENLPNAHLLLSHQEFPHQILSELSHTVLLV
jgi:hypothetical protein